MSSEKVWTHRTTVKKMKMLSFSCRQLHIATAITLLLTSVIAAPQTADEQETQNAGDRVKDDQQESHRDDRLLIALVQIETKECKSTNPADPTGMCYTAQGCKDKGGTAAGTCANGLGTCCVFTRSCETETAFNHTLFTSPLIDGKGACSVTVHRQHSDICQIRLDFKNLELSQPDHDGNCNTDFFTVTGGTNNVPIICGSNTGQHVYVDVESNGGPVKLTVDRSTTTSPVRSWNIEVTQIECSSRYRAPPGCLQYFTATSGTVESFNFDTAAPPLNPGSPWNGTRHLTNLDYGVCIQRASGYCGIVWERDTLEDTLDGGLTFTVSRNLDPVLPGLPGTPDAGESGDMCLTDYVGIPGGTYDVGVPGGTNTVMQSDRYCGLGFPPSVTSTSTPFALYVKTNVDEFGDGGNRGFRLNYRQKTSC